MRLFSTKAETGLSHPQREPLAGHCCKVDFLEDFFCLRRARLPKGGATEGLSRLFQVEAGFKALVGNDFPVNGSISTSQWRFREKIY